MNKREYSAVDRLLIGFDQALRTLFGRPQVTGRASPAAAHEETDLDERQRDLAARLMRIDHTGEVCAQALYQGQALTARLADVRHNMERAAAEENDHLDWCERRIEELGGRTSLLNPLWYAGSFAVGALAGLAGDKWSLGFVAETEQQVGEHLEGHLEQMPTQDARSRAILEQMRQDELQHAQQALQAGGEPLPTPAYWL